MRGAILRLLLEKGLHKGGAESGETNTDAALFPPWELVSHGINLFYVMQRPRCISFLLYILIKVGNLLGEVANH